MRTQFLTLAGYLESLSWYELLIAYCHHLGLFFCFLRVKQNVNSYDPQVTAAGDQLARLWDVRSGEPLGSFKGHLCSLKSVAFTPQEKGIL